MLIEILTQAVICVLFCYVLLFYSLVVVDVGTGSGKAAMYFRMCGVRGVVSFEQDVLRNWKSNSLCSALLGKVITTNLE